MGLPGRVARTIVHAATDTDPQWAPPGPGSNPGLSALPRQAAIPVLIRQARGEPVHLPGRHEPHEPRNLAA